MKHPRISARALIRSGDAVLVCSYRDRAGDWYVFPGGGPQSGETLHECLLRKVEEETGLKVERGRLRWVREFIAANFPHCEIDPSLHQVEMILECTVEDGQNASLGEKPDLRQTGLLWVPISQLSGLRFYPQQVAQILTGDLPDQTYLGAV